MVFETPKDTAQGDSSCKISKTIKAIQSCQTFVFCYVLVLGTCSC